MCFDTNKQYLGSGDVMKDVKNKTNFHFKFVNYFILYLVSIKIRKR